jgi:hypothetical protein
MGWVYEDDRAHEGYVVALVRVERDGGYFRYRELSYPDDTKQVERIHVFQAACGCGWRSRRFHAPMRANYSPFTLELGDEETEGEALQLWQQHCVSERQGFRRLFPVTE